MWAEQQLITGYSSKPFCTGLEAASHGVIYPHASGTGNRCTSASAGGRRAAFSERMFKLLASDPDNEYMMIDATIVRAHQHSAGALKKTAHKRSAGLAED
jgi:hypothetical protein